MNTKERCIQAVRHYWNRYGTHAVATAACSVSVGILFVLGTSTFEARERMPIREQRPAIVRIPLQRTAPLQPAAPEEFVPPQTIEQITPPSGPEQKQPEVQIPQVRQTVPPPQVEQPRVEVKPQPIVEEKPLVQPVPEKPREETPSPQTEPVREEKPVEQPRVEPKPVVKPVEPVKEEPKEEIKEVPVVTEPEPVVTDDFPAFDHASYPVGRTPNWGAMRTPMEWERSYSQMKEEDFVSLPSYNMSVLTTPMDTLLTPLREENIPKITAKLFYSTRYFGAYNLDSHEFEAVHPGIDLKLARGTPVGAIGGGRVYAVIRNNMLGLHVIIEHHTTDGQVYFSVYGHLDSNAVKAGDSVTPGQMIGRVGMTGSTTNPHLHLQVDRKVGDGKYTVYWPGSVPSPAEAAVWNMNPITFIQTYRK